MVYGRLDVFWPDGKIENFPLSEENVSIGRSTGNTIVLDTETISRYHFTITRVNEKVFLTDLGSANGTFVDGSHVTDSAPVELDGGEEIQIGYMRMLYFAVDDDPTLLMTTALEDTQRVETETPGFRMELQPPPIAVAPGAYTSAELVIYNTGKTPLVFVTQVTGLPEGWARINRPMVEIDPGDSVSVLVNIKPVRRSDSVPGVYNAAMIVRLHDKPNEPATELPFKVTILAFGGFGMALGARRIGPRDTFQLHVHNQGSAPLPIRITGRDIDPDTPMHYTIQPSQLTLPPGQRMQITGRVRPAQRRLFGEADECPFDLVVQSLDTARFTAAVRGYVIDQPPLPFWASFAMLGGLVVAVGLIFLGILSLAGRVPDPVIRHFEVINATTNMPQGNPLQLFWEVENAAHVDLFLNDNPILTRQDTAGTGNATLDTTEISGSVVIKLVASSPDGSRIAVATQEVSVFVPVMITTLSLEPQPVVRHVTQNLTLTYDVSGAANLTLTGLENVAQSPVNLPEGGSGTVTFSALPSGDFAIVLDVTGVNGETAQQTLNITPVDPVCLSTATETLLRAAPDAEATIISVIASGVNLVVDARDPSGAWLRSTVPETGAAIWGSRTDFDCADNFVVDNLRQVTVDVDAFRPTATIAPPLTVLPTATATTITSGAPGTLSAGTPPGTGNILPTSAGPTPTIDTTGN